MAGLPGTGKTTLASVLAEKLSGAVLNKDDIRHAIFAPDDIEYSAAQDDFCVHVMLQAAEYLFTPDSLRHVFIDGRPFSRRFQIDEVVTFAERTRQSWRIIECTCSEESACSRLSLHSGHPARNRTLDLYLEVKNRFEPITLPKVSINTDRPLDLCVQQVLQALG